MNESDHGSEDFPFDYRTTSDRFQEKLREAQEHESERQILHDLERTHESSIEDHNLQAQHAELVDQVKEAEDEVQRLQEILAQRKKRRQYEAAIMKLTPEERADAMEVDDKDEDVIDKSVIFEYLIRIGSAPLPANAADMSGSTFVQPHAELRQKAMGNAEVLKQSEFSRIHFTKADNRISETDDGSVRYCELEGKAYDQEFTVTFEVLKAKLAINKLAFTVSMDFEMDAGPLLERIKAESNLLALFRLLVHYAKLDHLRSTTFESLKSIYSSRDILVDHSVFDRLKFKDPERHELVLTLVWQNQLKDIESPKSVINVCEELMPEIRMEPSGFPNDDTDLKERLPGNFQKLMSMKGVLLAAQIIINAAFSSN